MEKIHKDFSNYEEYKNMDIAVCSLNEFKAINNKIVNGTNIDYTKKIYHYISKIFNNLSDKQKIAIKELIEWSKDRRCDKKLEFIEKLNADEKIEVFNYIYWNREIDNQEIFNKFDLKELKRILNQKLNKSIFLDIEIEQMCPVCKSIGRLYIRDKNNKKGNYFSCKQCGHIINTKDECECIFCNRVEDNVYKSLKENLVRLIKRIDNTISEELKDENSLNISEQKMLEDYKLYRLNLDKDIRELFSYKPNSYEELKNIINRIDRRNSIYFNNNYKSNIKKKLIDNFIVYKINLLTYKKYQVKRLINDELIDHKSWDNFINSNYGLNELEKLFEVDNLKEFKKNNEIKFINKRIVISSYNYKKYLELNLQKGREFKYEVLNDEKYILNKYFFDYDKKLKYIGKSECVKNIFQSEAEKDMNMLLRNKYPDNIILVNYKINDLIDLDKIREKLEKDELKYLSEGATFNFALSDQEGNVIKVVQVQRGLHHNEKEWIWRDGVKKKICEICFIEYEEVF